jgi:peptidoglycan/xylan/chitin deacetylase (PgdA/CDA1 family)
MQQARTAKYLLRFDDICPTMNWKVWSQIEALLIEHRLKPILAVVPDNQDPLLRVEPAVEDFWQRVRLWQQRGWTIALHGFQHRYVATCAGLITGRKKTEFAGLPALHQEEKLRRGVEIFQREGIKPRVWIAPNNSFDATTVSLLPRFGIRIICDGHFRFPFLDPGQVLWVPQQLFGFRPAPPGVWTVCYHHNGWTSAKLEEFRRHVRKYVAQIASLEEVIRLWPGRVSGWSWFLCRSPRLGQFLTRCQLKLWSMWKPELTGVPEQAAVLPAPHSVTAGQQQPEIGAEMQEVASEM